MRQDVLPYHQSSLMLWVLLLVQMLLLVLVVHSNSICYFYLITIIQHMPSDGILQAHETRR